MAQGRPEHAVQMLRETVRRHEGCADLHCPLFGQAEPEAGHGDDAVASFARRPSSSIPDYHAARVEFARALGAIDAI